MGAAEIAAIAAAGMAAGAINTLVGSGTLITFPVLLAFGYSPVTANVSNTIGLVPGSVAGSIGYRRELAGQRTRVLRFGAASLIAASRARCSCSAAAVSFRGDSAGSSQCVGVDRLQPQLDSLVTETAAPEAPDRAPTRVGYLWGVRRHFGGESIMLLASLGLALPDDLSGERPESTRRNRERPWRELSSSRLRTGWAPPR